MDTRFTYFKAAKMCLLYPDCSAVDETCVECVSGQFSCLLEDPEPKGIPINWKTS